MLVEDLMQTDVVTSEYDSSLRTVAVTLLENGVGSSIISRDGDPMGIVTETDALQAGAETNRPFDEIPVEKVLSHPLITIAPDATIRKAVSRMKENGIKKLAVVEGIELHGIITQTDITFHFGDFVREVQEMDEQRKRWEARKADLDEF